VWTASEFYALDWLLAFQPQLEILRVKLAFDDREVRLEGPDQAVEEMRHSYCKQYQYKMVADSDSCFGIGKHEIGLDS
jgi:hypothetical protein